VAGKTITAAFSGTITSCTTAYNVYFKELISNKLAVSKQFYTSTTPPVQTFSTANLQYAEAADYVQLNGVSGIIDVNFVTNFALAGVAGV
jgi:hypothetical protein